jgi:hypothetical protein
LSVALRPAADAPPALRDDLLLAAAVVGAAAVLYLPGAWLVSGRLSRDLLLFALQCLLLHAVIAALQLAALRVGARRLAGPPALFGIAAAVGLAAAPLLAPWPDLYATRLGLLADGTNTVLQTGWLSLMSAAFLAWARAGNIRHARSTGQLREVQQAQLAARRELVDAQLRAVQARINPGRLFDALDTIERLQRSDGARADALFDALVLYLRAAMPRVDSPTSTLPQEIALAAACVRMQALSSGHAITLDVDAGLAQRQGEFPPGVLLPLVSGALAGMDGPGRLALAAGDGSATHMMLRLAVPLLPAEDWLQQARGSLQALYGERARLRHAALPVGPVELCIEVPHARP